MSLFFGWIVLCFVVGAIGASRKIGFFGAFLLSLFLSPIIGALITFNSKTKDRQRFEDEILRRTQFSDRDDKERTFRWEQAQYKYNQGQLTDAELEIERQKIWGR